MNRKISDAVEAKPMELQLFVGGGEWLEPSFADGLGADLKQEGLGVGTHGMALCGSFVIDPTCGSFSHCLAAGLPTKVSVQDRVAPWMAATSLT